MLLAASRKFALFAIGSMFLGACGGGAAPGASPSAAQAAPSAASKPAAPSSSSAKPSVAGSASAALAASASASVAAKLSGSAAAGLVTVKVGLSSASPSNAGAYVGDGLGLFEQQGIRVEHVIFNSASAVAPAMINNQIDVADVGINPAMFNTVIPAHAKVVADKGSTPPGFGFTSIVVRKDLADKIKGPADFKGIQFGMTPPGLGTSNGYALGVWLATAGATVNDFHIQPIPFPEQVAALSNKALDAAMMAEPFATQAVNNGIGVRLISSDKMVPYQQVAAITYTSGFIQKPDLATKYMVAYLQGIRAYLDAFKKGLNKDKIVGILAKETGIQDTKLWGEMIPAGLDPDGKLNVKNIQEEEDYFKKLGLIKDTTPAADTFIDESFAQQAARTLGPYG